VPSRASFEEIHMPRPTLTALVLLGTLTASLAVPSAQTFAGPSLNPEYKAQEEKDAAAAERLARAVHAVVKLKARALPDARSLATLGAEREGSAVVVGPNGLALTIGYLIIEAESIELEDSQGRIVPATTVAYDYATGFGLVRALAPLAVEPIPLGDSKPVSELESMIFATAGGIDAASSTTVVSRRRFAGYWEYMIDGAIFTTPPRFDHSGAALIDREGRLVGIGSLIVADAAGTGGQRRLPGNMFVPIELLKPIYDELVSTGTSKRGRHPWLGITSQELEGRVFVQKVQADSPAERAGLKAGDILLAIGSEKISKLEQFYSVLWKDRRPGDDIVLTVLQGTEVQRITVKSIDRADYVRAKARI
jgi:S1-C subfamily serine protease